MKQIRVLIAEDDMVGRKILESFLEPYAETITAADGVEAVTRFEESTTSGEPFDLVLLDIRMPRLHGLEVLEAIRNYERVNNVNSDDQVKVIMLTGLPDMRNINNSALLGAVDYMVKPIDETVLIRELQRQGIIDDPNDQWN